MVALPGKKFSLRSSGYTSEKAICEYEQRETNDPADSLYYHFQVFPSAEACSPPRKSLRASLLSKLTRIWLGNRGNTAHSASMGIYAEGRLAIPKCRAVYIPFASNSYSSSSRRSESDIRPS